jgi:competence protein ComEC
MSIGYLNRFGHPRPDVVERYRAAGANLLRTDQAGAVRLTIAGDGIVVRREREHARRYWRARPP